MADNPHFKVVTTCDTCGQCCGEACSTFISARGDCYPSCTDSVQFLPSLTLVAGTPVALQSETQKFGEFDPEVADGLEVPMGILQHAVETDTNGRLTNFKSVLVFAPGCGQRVGIIYTSGEFAEAQIAAGDPATIAALLAYPNFAKRIPNGHIRIL